MDGVLIIALFVGWMLDALWGDPECVPHPVVYFGKLISRGEALLNKGTHRMLKGALMAVTLIAGTYLFFYVLIQLLDSLSFGVSLLVQAALIFFGLAGKTLRKEVYDVFMALERSLDEGRRQVARIVGRDTMKLSENEVRKAALETLAENLSDGVVAPLFWLLILGVPGMMAYKMVNTLDSMIAYHSPRYLFFGRWAARIDDVANYIPARLTSFLMLLAVGRIDLIPFVLRFGKKHASPNSGYPEAALAGILDCRFGGPHDYFGEVFYKPYIGTNERILTLRDARCAVSINRRVEVISVLLVALSLLLM
ncbi:MAG: adenosylcobinamide-phosphate synthase CbiB [Bacteroidales bacterium]|nr:adenosylcobinamide-phosphate synthase CbiB [Bacteroidales bacterium]